MSYDIYSLGYRTVKISRGRRGTSDFTDGKHFAGTEIAIFY